MKESDFQIMFKHWLSDNPQPSTAFELKIEKGKSMRFDKVAKHQRRGLYNANKKMLYWKIPDSNWLQKPFDCFVLNKVPAYVVIWFYKPRKDKFMLWFDINKYIKIMRKYHTKRKSLKEDEWILLADRVIKFS